MTDPQPRLGLAGRSGWGRMAATPEDQAGQLRQFLLSGRIASMTLADGADRDRQVLGLVGARYPKAVEALGRPSILALTRTLGPGTCSWCAAATIAAGNHEPAPDLGSAAHRALLGNPCRRCLTRYQARKAAAAERAHLGELQASGLYPAAAGRLRTSEEIRRQAAGIQRLRQNPLPPAPTGMLWTGSTQPPEVTAALTAALAATDRRATTANPPPALRKRVPPPSYWRPNPSWPGLKG